MTTIYTIAIIKMNKNLKKDLSLKEKFDLKNYKNLNNELNEEIYYYFTESLLNLLTNNLDSFENLKSSITLSLKMKRILDKLKQDKESYEEVILKLTNSVKKLEEENNELRKQVKKYNVNINKLEYKRKRDIIDLKEGKIFFSYNKFEFKDDDFYFALKFDKILISNKEIDLRTNKNFHDFEVGFYFGILSYLIFKYFNKKINVSSKMVQEPRYWLYSFEKLNLPSKIFEKDVEEKVEKFRINKKLKESEKN